MVRAQAVGSASASGPNEAIPAFAQSRSSLPCRSNGGGHRPFACGQIGDVEWQRHHVRPKRGGCALQRGRVEVDEYHRGTPALQLGGSGRAEPTSRPSDQNNLTR